MKNEIEKSTLPGNRCSRRIAPYPPLQEAVENGRTGLLLLFTSASMGVGAVFTSISLSALMPAILCYMVIGIGIHIEGYQEWKKTKR